MKRKSWLLPLPRGPESFPRGVLGWGGALRRRLPLNWETCVVFPVPCFRGGRFNSAFPKGWGPCHSMSGRCPRWPETRGH